jgi:hypothetical protein
MLHQHTVALASPESRQVTEVSPQPTAGMGGGEIAQAGSQGKVVFGVKNKKGHLLFTINNLLFSFNHEFHELHEF